VYLAVTPWLPVAVGTNATEHVPALSEQEAGVNEPAAELVQVTEPLGWTLPSGPASTTDAEQVVVCPVTTDVGAHVTDVVVARSAIAREVVEALPRWEESPT
jgi:hypothetical protein